MLTVRAVRGCPCGVAGGRISRWWRRGRGCAVVAAIAEARADARSRSTHARLLDRTAAALCEAGRRELQGRTATARGVERLQVCSGGRLCLVQGKGRCSTLKRVEARFCWRDETDRRMWAREERPYQQRPAQGSQSWHWRTRGGEASREQIADSGWTLAWLGSGMRRSCVETWAALRNAARRRRGEAFAIIYLFARFSASVYPSGCERMRYVHASVLAATHTPDETIVRGLRRLICRVRFVASLLESTESGSRPGLN